MTRFAGSAAVLVLGVLLTVAPPVQASCPFARLIRSIDQHGYSYINTPGVVPTLGVSSSVTDGAKGAFWILGWGDPTPHPAGYQQGIDNGAWPAVEGSYGYYYYGWLTFSQLPNVGPYSAVISGTWTQDARIDGCPDAVANPCIAVLINDQHDGKNPQNPCPGRRMGFDNQLGGAHPLIQLAFRKGRIMPLFGYGKQNCEYPGPDWFSGIMRAGLDECRL